MNSRITLLGRVIVGSMFLLSGGGKLISPSKATVFAADLLPIQLADAGLLVLALSLFEVSLGFLLYIGKWPQIVAFFSCMLLLFFTVLALATPNIDSSCGCFGDLISTHLELSILPRNLTLLLLSLFLMRSSSNPVNTNVVNKNG